MTSLACPTSSKEVLISCYEWERGSITLPSAAVAGVRKALIEASNKAHDQAYEQSRAWLKAQPSRHPTKVNDALWRSGVSETVSMIIQDLLSRSGHLRQGVSAATGPLPLPTHEDVDRMAPRASNRTTRFELDEASITFTGRVVTWQVEENNHSVDRAREHPLGKAFFAALAQVQWTRATGGQLIGNNEYNRESQHEGGGGNYVTATFGPRTQEQLRKARARW